MNASLVIRPARLADAAGIAAIHVETWQSAYAGIIGDDYLVGLKDRATVRSWRRELLSSHSGHQVLAAVARDPASGVSQIVGFGSCGRRRSVALPYGGEIYTLYVSSDWQGRGLGRRLLTGLFRRLVLSDRRSAFLWVLSANPSRWFYEAMAGRPVAERRERFAGSLLEETAYAWPDLESWLAAQPEPLDRP